MHSPMPVLHLTAVVLALLASVQAQDISTSLGQLLNTVSALASPSQHAAQHHVLLTNKEQHLSDLASLAITSAGGGTSSFSCTA